MALLIVFPYMRIVMSVVKITLKFLRLEISSGLVNVLYLYGNNVVLNIFSKKTFRTRLQIKIFLRDD